MKKQVGLMIVCGLIMCSFCGCGGNNYSGIYVPRQKDIVGTAEDESVMQTEAPTKEAVIESEKELITEQENQTKTSIIGVWEGTFVDDDEHSEVVYYKYVFFENGKMLRKISNNLNNYEEGHIFDYSFQQEKQSVLYYLPENETNSEIVTIAFFSEEEMTICDEGWEEIPITVQKTGQPEDVNTEFLGGLYYTSYETGLFYDVFGGDVYYDINGDEIGSGLYRFNFADNGTYSVTVYSTTGEEKETITGVYEFNANGQICFDKQYYFDAIYIDDVLRLSDGENVAFLISSSMN